MRAGEAVRTVEGSEVPAVENIHDSIASLDLVIPSGTSRLHPAVHVPNHHSHRVAGLVQFHSALVRCGWRCGDEGTIPVLLRELLDQRALASATEPNYCQAHFHVLAHGPEDGTTPVATPKVRPLRPRGEPVRINAPWRGASQQQRSSTGGSSHRTAHLT